MSALNSFVGGEIDAGAGGFAASVDSFGISGAGGGSFEKIRVSGREMMGSHSHDLGADGVDGEFNWSGFGVGMEKIRGFEGVIGSFEGAVDAKVTGSGNGGGASSNRRIENWEVTGDVKGNVGGFDGADVLIDASDLGLEALDNDTMSNEDPKGLCDKGGLDVNSGGTGKMARDEERNDNVVQFLPSDLVWGKVRSHPWWPGQIFEPWDASEIAKKHFKPNSYLVAYFGDHSFGWNEEVKLKPFWQHFAQMAKQSTAGGFLNALDGAFTEAYRRVEFAMSCRCTDEGTYKRIRTQIVKCDGIREESSVREGGDQFFTASSFEPVKFVPYIKALALLPDVELDKLEVVMAGALLSAFYRWKGYYTMEKFTEPSQLFENEADGPSLIEKKGTDFRVDEETDINGKKQGRRRVGTMSSTAKKWKLAEPLDSTSEVKVRRRRRKGASDLDVIDTKQSPKVGESLRKVATQLRRAASIAPLEHCSPDELLSQLLLAANNPTTGYGSLSSLVSFFSYFRNSVIHQGQFYGDMTQEMSESQSKERSVTADVIEGSEESSALRKSKRKRTFNSKYIGYSADNFEDSYWTDRIITVPVEEPFPVDENAMITVTNAPTPDGVPSRLPTGRSDGDNQSVGEKEGTSPTAMILNFSDPDSIPLEEELNEVFRQYGSLLESETELLRKSSCAKVVFRRKSDAEIAFSSSGKFKAFGPSLSSYRLNYDPMIGKTSAGKPPEEGLVVFVLIGLRLMVMSTIISKRTLRNRTKRRLWAPDAPVDVSKDPRVSGLSSSDLSSNCGALTSVWKLHELTIQL
ncbi:PWWP domain-containing protein [Drosera capensis]